MKNENSEIIVEDNGVEVIVKRNVSTIIKLILDYYRERVKKGNKKVHLYFRGENEKFPRRTPSLYLQKKLVKSGSEYYYRSLLNELGKDDYLESSSLVRMLSELQHYGAKTRMLDVSKNPLVGLYFAVDKHDDKPGYLYVYSSNQDEEKFDTGHTIAIKNALNLIDQEVINDFLEACDYLIKIKKEDIGHLEFLPLEQILAKYDKIDNSSKVDYAIYDLVNKARIIKFMELLNQRAKVREELKYPIRIYNDLCKAHIILPSINTDRIQQQQGAFIFPKYVNTKNKSLEEIQSEIDKSIQEFTAEMHEKDKKFVCIKINPGDKKIIRKELSWLGITPGFLFPDIQHRSETLLDE